MALCVPTTQNGTAAAVAAAEGGRRRRKIRNANGSCSLSIESDPPSSVVNSGANTNNAYLYCSSEGDEAEAVPHPHPQQIFAAVAGGRAAGGSATVAATVVGGLTLRSTFPSYEIGAAGGGGCFGGSPAGSSSGLASLDNDDLEAAMLGGL